MLFRFHHFRDKDGAEVDTVIERLAGQIAGVEVRASATVNAADFRGLRNGSLHTHASLPAANLASSTT